MRFLVDKLPDCCRECCCCFWNEEGWQCRICGYLNKSEIGVKRSGYCPLSEFNKVFIGDGFVRRK